MDPIILKTIKQIKRLLIIAVGFTVILIGIVMIVLPGPALITIPLGLVILASELVWAKSILNKIKSTLKKHESAREK
ncbi:MAG: PGPGW domain-containing protein [Pseudomonadota bacterium]